VSSPSYELGSIGKKLRKMTLEQFRETCDPAEIIALRGQTTSDDCYAGHNVVLRALGNPSPRDRVGIVTDLLDHGWEVGRMDLFMLLENKKRDVPVELPLVERLLAGGSDPNYLERRGSRPVMLLLRGWVSDEDAAPILDAILRDGRFEPHQRATDGQSVWRRLHQSRLNRAQSIDAIRAYCQRTGRPIPRLGDMPERSFDV